MNKITPFLWFDDKAEEAMNFYMSIFKDSKVLNITRYGKDAPYPEGTAFVVSFLLSGQEFMAVNAGPEFKFTEAISLYVDCESQQEVDELWDRLSEGGEKSRCGWLKDRYGLSWQIIPTILGELVNDKDVEKARRVTQAMLEMDKIDIDGLKRAYERV
jgi:predicted 3-demethylubiquinone-9 3-methyltransferase (glyoxalase superfamily)